MGGITFLVTTFLCCAVTSFTNAFPVDTKKNHLSRALVSIAISFLFLLLAYTYFFNEKLVFEPSLKVSHINQSLNNQEFLMSFFQLSITYIN